MQAAEEEEEKCAPTLPSDGMDSEPGSSSLELSPLRGKKAAVQQALPSLSPSASASITPTVQLPNSEKSTMSGQATVSSERLSGTKRSAPDTSAELQATSAAEDSKKRARRRRDTSDTLLTEKQKEVRREQHKKAKLFDYEATEGSLTSLDIQEELYGMRERDLFGSCPPLTDQRGRCASRRAKWCRPRPWP